MDWYHTLNKPVLNPPDWIFAPAWTFLYITMALSLIIYLNDGINRKTLPGLMAFVAQLFLNLLWAPTFFSNKNIEGAFVVIILLIVALIITMSLFFRHSKAAFVILIPYFLWVSYAAYLNYEILRLN